MNIYSICDKDIYYISVNFTFVQPWLLFLTSNALSPQSRCTGFKITLISSVFKMLRDYGILKHIIMTSGDIPIFAFAGDFSPPRQHPPLSQIIAAILLVFSRVRFTVEMYDRFLN